MLDFIVSYGEMSRRSGVAAEEDNHSDISPSTRLSKSQRSLRTGPREWNQ
jgi:hypothetical protein